MKHEARVFDILLKQLRKEAWKIQDFNGAWTRDFAIPVRRSNQLSYEATDVGSWSFPWGMNQRWNDIWNGSYMNCGYEIKWSYDPRSYERNFCNREVTGSNDDSGVKSNEQAWREFLDFLCLNNLKFLLTLR